MRGISWAAPCSANRRGIDEPAACVRPVRGVARRAEDYFADFVAVRRQRVQTIAFTVVPPFVIANGCRFGW